MDGKPHGQGTATKANGDVFTGQFVQGVVTGQGTLRSKVDGQTYEGSFLDNKFHGNGVQTMANGDTYSGMFLQGKRQGYGVYTRTDYGMKYEGEFVNGKMHGICTETNMVANKSRKGVWENGVFTS